MKHKLYVNILIILGSSAVLLFLWYLGLKILYAKILIGLTNLFLLPWPDTYLKVFIQADQPVFEVFTLIDGKNAKYPQETKLILLPILMILTWQTLIFFNLHWKKAWASTLSNLGIFLGIQVIFVLLLTSYYTSPVAKYIYDLLTDSFYIVALFLIVKDTFKYRLINFKS